MEINGKQIAQEKLAELKERVAGLSYVPQFCDVYVPTDTVSAQYVRMKERRAQEVGIEVVQAPFNSSVTTEDLITEIERLNQLPRMRGLIVQLPLPDHVDTEAVLNAIAPAIDVDVLGDENESLFYEGTPRYVFPTAKAVLYILDTVAESLKDKQVVMVGYGKLVGRPVVHLLEARGVSVTVVTRDTENPIEKIQRADVVISAAGTPDLITGSMVKDGVIAIDAGTAEVGGGVSGDIDTQTVAPKASYLAAVPGGVGPVTVASLLENVVLSAERESL